MKNIDKILDIINSEPCWITVKWISGVFWNTIDKTTIYRNLDKLLIDGIILEDFSQTWEKLYSIKEKHHHHFICDICNQTANIWCTMDKKIKKLENNFWFKVKNHSFVLNWICRNCM